MELVMLLTVKVLVCPAKMLAGLNEQVRLAGQLSVMLPLKLLDDEAATVKVADPLPISVVTFGEDEDMVNCASPVPARATDCGLPAALSLIDKAPPREPDAVGVNVTLTLQLWPTFRSFSNALQVFV